MLQSLPKKGAVGWCMGRSVQFQGKWWENRWGTMSSIKHPWKRSGRREAVRGNQDPAGEKQRRQNDILHLTSRVWANSMCQNWPHVDSTHAKRRSSSPPHKKQHTFLCSNVNELMMKGKDGRCVRMFVCWWDTHTLQIPCRQECNVSSFL